MNRYLVTFFSTHHALKAEKLLKEKIKGVTLIPTPREISSECGFSLFLENTNDSPQELLSSLSYEHLYMIGANKQGERTYEKID